MPTPRHRPTSRLSLDERADVDALLSRIAEALAARQMTRSALAARQMTRSALADEIGRSRGTVSEWWTKRHAPDAVSLMKLPIALGCNGHWLLTGSGARLDSASDRDGEASYVLGGGDALARVRQLVDELSSRWVEPLRVGEQQRATAERAARDVQLIERILTPPHRKKVRRVR